MKFRGVSVVLAVMLTACGTSPMKDERGGQGPLQLELVKGVAYPADMAGFQPDLPGYRLDGSISTVRVRGLHGGVPSQPVILAIRTTAGLPPKLEGLTIETPDVMLSGSPFTLSRTLQFKRKAAAGAWEPGDVVPVDAYVSVSTGEGQVYLALLPSLLELLGDGATISWVDYYRK